MTSRPKTTQSQRDTATTSRIMAAVRGRDTRPEMMLRRHLHARGLRFRVHPGDVPGKPDIVNRSRRVAVFVDGDFWHANPREWERRGFARMEDQFPVEKRDGWSAKLRRNVERDREITECLLDGGWTVVRLWESDVRADVSAAAAKVEAVWR